MGFLHGVEVLEVSGGTRPISTVSSSVIGIIGTAPNSQAEVKATLATGVVASNNAQTWTAKALGVIGNNIALRLVDPKANSAALSISVTDLTITVNLATSVAGAITTTATQLATAIAAHAGANALVGIANTGASTGAGVVAALNTTYLSGGINEAFPINTPVLVAGSRTEAAALGLTGSLPQALDSILDQTGAVIVVIRVTAGVDDTATMANIVGGTNAGTGQYEGVHAFRAAESILGVVPRILIAPGFTHQRVTTANAVVAELVGVANRLGAIIVVDGPNTTDAAAQTYRGDWGSSRIYMHDPFDLKTDATGAVIQVPASSRIAGQIAKRDNEEGPWASPSNQEVVGIVGTARAVDFVLGDETCRANLLNSTGIATTIRHDGFRLWGNRTLSSDPKWAFLSVRRTADMINDSLKRAHLWAVDRNITANYVTEVTEGVRDYLRHLKKIGAILGGDCWADPALNSPDQIAQGRVYFDFDFTVPSPAERVTFRSHSVDDYFVEIF